MSSRPKPFFFLAALALFFTNSAFAQQEGAPPSQATDRAAAQPAATPPKEAQSSQAAPRHLRGDELPPNPTALDVITQAARHADRDIGLRRNYTYQEREVDKEFDGKGNVKKTTINTYDVLTVANQPYRKLIAKDDKPLSDKEQATQEAEMKRAEEKREQKRAKREDEDPKQQAKDKRKEDEDERKAIRAITEVYDLTFAGEEVIDGEPAWIIQGVPKPGYQSHSMETHFLKCMQGKVWITKRDLEFVRLDLQVTSDFSFGLFLAKLDKGTVIHVEQTRVNNEIWLPRHEYVKAAARLAWHTERVESETDYSNYKKFRTDAKVTGVVGEAKSQ